MGDAPDWPGLPNVGASGVSVGAPVTGGTPSSLLATDSSGNVANGPGLTVIVKDGDLYLDPAKNGVTYGAGAGDQAAAMQALFGTAMSQGKVIKFRGGAEVVLNTPHYIQGAPMVEADGAVFLCGHTNDAIYNFSGDTIESAISSAAGQHSYTSMVSLTADSPVNTDSATDQVVNVPTAGIAQGDIVMIGDLTTLVGGNSATNTNAALNMYEVKTILSSSQLTVTAPLIYPMLVANGAYLLTNKALTAAQGAQGGFWHGGTFIGTQPYTGTETASALRFWSLRDMEVFAKAQELTDFAFIANDCWSLTGAVDVADLADVGSGGSTGQYGYGWAWGGSCANGSMRVNAKRVRHGSAFVGTGHNCWADVIATGTTSTAADAHAGFTLSGYRTVQADGCPVAIALRGKGYRAGIVDARNVNTGLYVLDVPGDVIVDRLDVTTTIPQDSTADPTGASGHAVRVDQSCGRLIIGGGRWEDIQGHGVYLNLSETASDLVVEGVSAQNLHGNSHSSGLGYLVYTTSSSGINRGRIANNQLDDNQGSPTTTAVIYAGTSNLTDVQLKNNLKGSGIVDSAGPNQGLVTVNDVSVFTPVLSSYTAHGSSSYNVPAGATRLTITTIGAGGGGGSGGEAAAGTQVYGGAGGAGGGWQQITLPVSQVTSPVTITVGAGGAGGAAVSAAGNGNPGGGGGYSAFGSYLRGYGGSPGGAGGTAAPSNASGGTGIATGGAGQGGGTTNGNGANLANGPGGGGAGGGINTSSATGTGGAGSAAGLDGNNQANGGTGGTNPGGSGSAGGAPTTPTLPGTGGGGGGSSTTAAGAGGAGGGAGGGGGGGGATQTGGTSGAGGAGSDGAVYIYAT